MQLHSIISSGFTIFYILILALAKNILLFFLFSFIVLLAILQGAGGITVKKTSQALIFGIYDEPLTPGQCNMIVERLGDYLIDQGL
jgi:hypothetical protein